MRKILAILLFFMSTSSYACPAFYFHITFAGTKTFTIQDVNNPAVYINVTGAGSIDAWSFNTSLGSPCGITFGADVCYSILEVTEHLTTDEKIAIRFNGNSPADLTIAYNSVSRTFTVVNPGDITAYSLSWGNCGDNPPVCCAPAITITGAYAVPLTQSGTWIKSLSTTVIPGNADVRLDADPVSGYVELNTGFETKPLVGYAFVAQALDGCGAGIPMRPASGIGAVSDGIVKIKAVKPVINNNSLSVYPNPTKGNVMVRHNRSVKTLQLYTATGTLIVTVNVNNSMVTEMPLASHPPGIYILKADGKIVSRIVKQ
jgi:hypothetical protein